MKFNACLSISTHAVYFELKHHMFKEGGNTAFGDSYRVCNQYKNIGM
jgi:hypothetical protein